MLSIVVLLRGKRWKSSSVMNGMNGDKSLNPRSKQVYKTRRADAFLDSSLDEKIGFKHSK